MKIKGKPFQSFYNTSDKLTLEKPDSSLLAYGLWKVPQTGFYRIRLECDDFGSLNLDGQDLIRLTGINAHNIGEVQAELKEGYHLLVLHLVNGPGQGWLTLNTISKQNTGAMLGGASLVYLDFTNLNLWLKFVSGVKKGSLVLLIFALGALIFLAVVQLGRNLKEKESLGNLVACPNYLKSPIRFFGIPVALILVYIYEILTKPDPYPNAFGVVLLLVITVCLIIFRRPRWITYAFLLIALTAHIFVFENLISKGEQDPVSTRDEAVEVAARSILDGQNAWNKDVGAPITTGPASILIALPFIFMFGEINWLSFLFWMIFSLILLWFDLRHQNNSWPVMAMFIILGYFGIGQTLYWSLDELYYPFLYLTLAYFLVGQGNFFIVGMLTAAVLLSRFSYFFMIIGFGLWILFNFPLNGRHLFKMGLGFILGAVAILLPFVIVGGKDFWINNSWNVAFNISGGTWPDNNLFFKFLNHLNTQFGPVAMRWVKLGLTLSFMIPLSWGLRLLKVPHPFWHITFGAFLAHTIVWLPVHLPVDYALIFVLPAMLAISNTPINDSFDKDNS